MPPTRRRNPEANRRHQRAFYWRRRNYLGVTRRGIQYDERVISMLIRDGWLDLKDSDDPAAIWSAINQFVKDAAEDGSGWTRVGHPPHIAGAWR